MAFSFIPASYPMVANAGLFNFMSSLFGGSQTASVDQSAGSNSQNLPLLANHTTFDSGSAQGGDDLIFANNEALVSENGPAGTLADIPDAGTTGQISKYMVRNGDTISGIAKMFGVSRNTVIWANNLTSENLQIGQILVILPVSGTIHTVASGDTVQSIAKKYKADPNEVAQFNGLALDATLTIGDQVVIPDGEGSSVSLSSSRAFRNSKSVYEPYLGGSGPDYPGYYIRPLVGGVKTQGLHGWNAIDIGTPVGTPILAAAAGEIIVARQGGWNGGYGNYIVISHDNGTQTVYGHLSHVLVSDGQRVVQGQVIGLSGNTGNSTGPHLHFEVRGAKNPLGP
jgi:LysM repeat protein